MYAARNQALLALARLLAPAAPEAPEAPRPAPLSPPPPPKRPAVPSEPSCNSEPATPREDEACDAPPKAVLSVTPEGLAAAVAERVVTVPGVPPPREPTLGTPPRGAPGCAAWQAYPRGPLWALGAAVRERLAALQGAV